MSQRSEKLRRQLDCQKDEMLYQSQRIDVLMADMANLQQAQLDSDRFTATIHTIQTQTATEEAKLRRGIAARCREAEHRASQWRLNAYLMLAAVALLATICLVIGVKAAVVPDKPAEIAAQPVSVIQVMDEPQETDENALIEVALLARATVIEDCTVTHYDCCVQCCGKSDGITASGVQATPGVTVAVDPSVIPLGSDVLVDYGDGIIHYYRADDIGSAIKGDHIDLCVTDHETALKLGRRTATVYYVPQEGAK